MSITLRECKDKGGKVYDLEDTARKVCILPKVGEKKNNAILIDGFTLYSGSMRYTQEEVANKLVEEGLMRFIGGDKGKLPVGSKTYPHEGGVLYITL